MQQRAAVAGAAVAAAEAERWAMVRRLVELGADCDSLLLLATRAKRSDVATFLLEKEKEEKEEEKKEKIEDKEDIENDIESIHIENKENKEIKKKKIEEKRVEKSWALEAAIGNNQLGILEALAAARADLD